MELVPYQLLIEHFRWGVGGRGYAEIGRQGDKEDKEDIENSQFSILNSPFPPK
ncbi:MAG: hypothetical protein F6K47_17540 [Symploca sp. SIO2E6]|nr:hypothetical protein [Symploca sp. SIO2E6]